MVILITKDLLAVAPHLNIPLSSDAAYQRYTAFVTHLVHCCQSCGENPTLLRPKVIAEIGLLSQGQMRLHVLESATTSIQATSDPNWERSLVQWAGTLFGMLHILHLPGQSPLLPADLAHRFAQDCGWLLHLAEQRPPLASATAFTTAIYRIKQLPPKQRQVLSLMMQGASVPQIAQQLSIQPKTVRTHQYRLYHRLQVHSRWEAMRCGFLAELDTPDSVL